MGTGSVLAKLLFLIILECFRLILFSGWSSRTGLAGVAAAGITLLFKIKDIHSKFLYL